MENPKIKKDRYNIQAVDRGDRGDTEVLNIATVSWEHVFRIYKSPDVSYRGHATSSL